MTDGGMAPFGFPGLPTRIEFGARSRYRLVEAADRAGIDRPLVLTTPRGALVLADIDSVIPVHACAVFEGSRVHVPAGTIEEAQAVARDARADGVIAIGGGSAIGLAKALAHYDGLPFVALPTTLAGSEMTSVWGETTDGHKRTARDEKVRPREVIYDPELLQSLSTELAVQSAINALAHVAEAAYAHNTSPLVQTLAHAGAEAISDGLEGILRTQRGALDRLLYGAMLAGMCLSSAAMCLHHKICHVIGGALDLPHAATHAIVLPHALALNLPGAPTAEHILASAFRSSLPEKRLHTLLAQSSAPVALAQLGAPRNSVLALAGRVVEELGDPPTNPVAVTDADIELLLGRAWEGASPER
ncbi:MAG TPA: iron-containing alcohol dehydrogenase [Microbacterium sp.]|nr:iron-containing alcohol dehydrogenase [Microbacterium sp.]